jgi:hypothetical protein
MHFGRPEFSRLPKRCIQENRLLGILNPLEGWFGPADPARFSSFPNYQLWKQGGTPPIIRALLEDCSLDDAGNRELRTHNLGRIIQDLSGKNGGAGSTLMRITK